MILDKQLPDKWIRKALSEALDGVLVNGKQIPIFDYRVTGKDLPHNYITINSQSNLLDRVNKCGAFWNNNTQIQVVTRYFLPGNTGSRLMADEIMDKVRSAALVLQLDTSSTLEILTRVLNFPADFATTYNDENLFVKNINLNLLIN